MTIYEVGKKCFPATMMDGAIFDMDDGGGMLLIQMQKPTAAERRAFKDGLSFRFAVVEDIIFVLVRMGTMPWMDAPYYRALSRNLTRFMVPQPGQGLAIQATLVDSTTGIVEGLKLVSLKTDETLMLMRAIHDQPVIPDYDSRLRRVMAQYSVDDLVRISQ